MPWIPRNPVAATATSKIVLSTVKPRHFFPMVQRVAVFMAVIVRVGGNLYLARRLAPDYTRKRSRHHRLRMANGPGNGNSRRSGNWRDDLDVRFLWNIV